MMTIHSDYTLKISPTAHHGLNKGTILKGIQWCLAEIMQKYLLCLYGNHHSIADHVALREEFDWIAEVTVYKISE